MTQTAKTDPGPRSSSWPCGSVCFVTLGCPKNEADTERMCALLRRAGYRIVEEPFDADVVVVNTCSFISSATEESLDAIFTLLGEGSVAQRRPDLVVAGCMPSRYGADLESQLPEASAFLPSCDEDDIVEVIGRLLDASHKPGNPASECEQAVGASLACSAGAPSCADERNVEGGQDWLSGFLQGGLSAYVKISDGCDRFCSFCTIPFIRGRYRSRPAADILAEVGALERQGTREVVLVGQDTGIWGCDLDEGHDLAWLLKTLAESFPYMWIRVMYLQPEGITESLLTVFAEHDNICNYLDIPLQHANAAILKAMNRAGSAGIFKECVDKARSRLGQCAVRTTLIAGFPGESRVHAKEQADMLESIRFDYAGVFPYSQEEGTKAGLRQDQIPVRTRMSRAQRLRDLADAISFSDMNKRIGEVFDVLVEGQEEDDGVRCELVGRTKFQAPEVDGAVHLPAGSARIGDIVPVRLLGCFAYEYEGEVVGKPLPWPAMDAILQAEQRGGGRDA